MMSNDTTEKEDTELKKEHQGVKENSDTFDFEPFLYSFETSPLKHSSSTVTVSFDDRLRQDHVFGIIWILFSKQEKSPNIEQLHWGLQFLQKLKTSDGTYPEDVNKCIQMIQDNLIKQYAKLGTKLNQFVENFNESIKKDKYSFRSSTPKPKRFQDTSMSMKIPNGLESKYLYDMTSLALLADDPFRQLSITYDEMMLRGPFPCSKQVAYTNNELLETNSSYDSIKKFMKNLRISEEATSNMSKEELLQFFNTLRKEYVDTVKKQVDKIHSLENFMQGIDDKSFKAYITDDFIKYLSTLEDSNNDDSTASGTL